MNVFSEKFPKPHPHTPANPLPLIPAEAGTQT